MSEDDVAYQEPQFEKIRRGTRRVFTLRVFDPCGAYPQLRFRRVDALYVATESFVYSVVANAPPNKWGWSEIAWNNLSEVRLWGALALSIREGRGFYSFVPEHKRSVASGTTLYLQDLRDDVVEAVAERIAARGPSRKYELHWVQPRSDETARLYDALLMAHPAVLRGVNCFLKSLLLWNLPSGILLQEELGINLYIALEGGLSEIRRGLSKAAGRSVSYQDVFAFVEANFTAGDALADYWQDAHDDRNALLHPDNDFSPYVIQPMSADDIWELFDPMLSLYRYILLGEPRPTIEEISGRS